MTVYNTTPATLDLYLAPGSQSVTFTFNNGALNMTGTWAFTVRDSFESDTARLEPTVNTTGAATGTIVVPFTEAQLLGLIGTNRGLYEGVYTIERNTMPIFSGVFRIEQKATRD